MMDIQYCWEDSETGCICGNECEPPAWVIKVWEADEKRWNGTTDVVQQM